MVIPTYLVGPYNVLKLVIILKNYRENVLPKIGCDLTRIADVVKLFTAKSGRPTMTIRLCVYVKFCCAVRNRFLNELSTSIFNMAFCYTVLIMCSATRLKSI